MRSGRHGFTLIELLVVIAIIAILAAMLFPVFARARESARKIQCLSNVKNVALAMQMYLTDYDAFPPAEHDPSMIAFWESGGAKGGSPSEKTQNCSPYQYTRGNPFLRWAVILEEYVKNRDVYRCPSAINMAGARWIVPGTSGTDVLAYYRAHVGEFGGETDYSLCYGAWPVGWGGTITDSIAQGTLAYPGGMGGGIPGGAGAGQKDTGPAFEQTIGFTELGNVNGTLNYGLKTAQISDAASFVVCGDTGGHAEINVPTRLAYPDMCRVKCGTNAPGCCGADWVNCSWSIACGVPWQDKVSFWFDPTVVDSLHATRHLGGSNIGYADGHAGWMNSQAILKNCTGGGPRNTQLSAGPLQGMGCYCEYDHAE